ncbi:Golgi apyrase [Coemansia erecta]|uniref:Golgi apyrase n=1 Tax=Coemansia erecta TaxID=147472 RepID=A0A9W7XYZ0_9FUNG|nr:Golgi apyrase [Coemansia erecta]
MALSGWLHRLWATATGSGGSTGAVLPLTRQQQQQQQQRPTRRRVAALAAAAALSLCVLGAFYRVLAGQPAPRHEAGSAGGRRFGVVIDAGSSGSRVMVYAWDDPAAQLARLARNATAGALPFRLPAVSRAGERWAFKTEPGISSFAGAAQHVGAQHIRPLLDFAQQQIPAGLQASTPVLLLATAGMRLLPPAQRAAVMAAACAYARENYAFAVDACAHSFRVVSGEHEGLYGWLAANYLLGALDGHVPTLGFLDMGGASAQIAFEAAAGAAGVAHVTLRALDGRARTAGVFAATFLGHGTHEARRRYEAGLAPPADDPCLAPGLRLPLAAGALRGLGSFDACVAATRPLLNKTAPCARAPCLFAGVSAPPIDYARQQFVGVSEYWYAAHDFLALGGAWDAARFEQRARAFCATPWDRLLGQHGGDEAHVRRLQMQCFKAAWLVNVLHEGFGVPRGAAAEPRFRSLESVEGVEVSWTLGALLLHVSQTVAPAAGSPGGSRPGIRLPQEPGADADADAGAESLPWLARLPRAWAGLSLAARAALVACAGAALLLLLRLLLLRAAPAWRLPAWRLPARRRAAYGRVGAGAPAGSPIALDMLGPRQGHGVAGSIDADDDDDNAKEPRRSPSASVLDMLPRPLHAVLSPPVLPASASSSGFLSPLSAPAPAAAFASAADMRPKGVAGVAESPPISRASSFSSLAMLNRRRGGLAD